MPYISKAVRSRVAAAAKYRCEYCQTSQMISGAQMHIEHIIPTVQGGNSEINNLCFACAWCNSYKGGKITFADPLTGEVVAFFNPRLESWRQHFQWHESGSYILGITSLGRATVEGLKMNNPFIVAARRKWVIAGWHPPNE